MSKLIHEIQRFNCFTIVFFNVSVWAQVYLRLCSCGAHFQRGSFVIQTSPLYLTTHYTGEMLNCTFSMLVRMHSSLQPCYSGCNFLKHHFQFSHCESWDWESFGLAIARFACYLKTTATFLLRLFSILLQVGLYTMNWVLQCSANAMQTAFYNTVPFTMKASSYT